MQALVPIPTIYRRMQISAQLQRLHENLESHLRPFWSSALPSRMVRVSVCAHPSWLDTDHHSVPLQPIVTTEFCTGSDGYFSGVLAITWDDICTHPNGSLIVFDETCLEHELEVHAHILKPNYSLTMSPPRAACIPITQSTVRLISDIDDTVKLSRVLDGARAVFQNVFVKDLKEAVIPGMAEWYTTLWGPGFGSIMW